MEVGRGLVPRGPDGALEDLHASLQQPPLRFVHQVVAILVVGQRDQRARGVVRPAVERADVGEGVALVVAADAVAPVPAGVQEHVYLPVAPTADDNRLLTHPPQEEVAGFRYLRFVADEQPRAVEHLLHLLVVDILVPEYLPTDRTVLGINAPLHLRRELNHDSLPDIPAAQSGVIQPHAQRNWKEAQPQASRWHTDSLRSRRPPPCRTNESGC